MMKRRLVFFLFVLSLAASANAVLVFTLDGEPQPAEITLSPSGTIELCLKWTPPGTGVSAYDIVYQLNNANAELITSGISFPANLDLPGTLVGTPQPQYVRMCGAQMFYPYQGTDPLMQGLILHYTGPGDVLLEVFTMGGTIVDDFEWPEYENIHTLLIHQTPEPATMILLGLGGLFLAQRKKF